MKERIKQIFLFLVAAGWARCGIFRSPWIQAPLIIYTIWQAWLRSTTTREREREKKTDLLLLLGSSRLNKMWEFFRIWSHQPHGIHKRFDLHTSSNESFLPQEAAPKLQANEGDWLHRPHLFSALLSSKATIARWRRNKTTLHMHRSSQSTSCASKQARKQTKSTKRKNTKEAHLIKLSSICLFNCLECSLELHQGLST